MNRNYERLRIKFKKTEKRIRVWKRMTGLKVNSKTSYNYHRNLDYNRKRLEYLKEQYPEEYTIYKLET